MDVFCKIINNEIPSYTIYEDDIVKVFLDVNPQVWQLLINNINSSIEKACFFIHFILA